MIIFLKSRDCQIYCKFCGRILFGESLEKEEIKRIEKIRCSNCKRKICGIEAEIHIEIEGPPPKDIARRKGS